MVRYHGPESTRINRLPNDGTGTCRMTLSSIGPGELITESEANRRNEAFRRQVEKQNRIATEKVNRELEEENRKWKAKLAAAEQKGLAEVPAWLNAHFPLPPGVRDAEDWDGTFRTLEQDPSQAINRRRKAKILFLQINRSRAVDCFGDVSTNEQNLADFLAECSKADSEGRQFPIDEPLPKCHRERGLRRSRILGTPTP